VATARKTRRSPTRGGRKRARPRPQPEAEAPAAIAEETPSPPPEEIVEQPLDGLPLSVPEPAFAERVPEHEPARPLPSTRRAIFFDVENTSRAEHIARVISHLAVDRVGRRTEFFAVGNWRVIGHDTARLLARHGAALVHSAPSVGVRDWSDLRIAVASGVWLAGARPGDMIEIVSDDRAFDAVGDVAASLGVTFRRLSYRGLLGMPTPEPVAMERVDRGYDHGDRGGRRRRRRGGRGRGEHVRVDHGVPRPAHHAAPPSHAPVHHAPRVASGDSAEPHTAPHDEIVSVVRELARTRGTVTLDSLANALKARGFSRPPGSPRLITRLRRIKELEVNRAGVITLVDGAAAAPAAPAPAAPAPPAEARDAEEPEERAPEPIAADEDAAESTDESAETASGAEDTGDAEGEAPDPRNREGAHLQTASGIGDGGGRRRRSRRGGRRRRGRGGDGRGGGGGGGRDGRDGGGRQGGGGGGGGGTPPRGRDAGPRGTGADRARDVASRYAPRAVAPSWISGQPLA
jgi:uncharacterized membrane protein YgcG